MQKIVAFIGSLLVIAPSIGQDAPKSNKTQGVSKVTQQNVSPKPATSPKPAATEQKSAATVKHSGNNNAHKSPGSATQLKNSGSQIKTSGK